MTNTAYLTQFNDKISRVHQLFAKFSPPEIETYRSPDWHFRQRAEFRVWHEKNEVFYAMFASGQKPSAKTLQRIDQLPIASKRINDLMPKLLNALQTDDLLIRQLYQVEFLSTLAGETLVTLIYHKRLNESWTVRAKPLEAILDIHLIGRSRKQKIVLSQDFVTEQFTVNESRYHFRQVEGGFTQPNAEVCQKMLTWASDCAQQIQSQSHKDLLELYCGNGNFTLPLSKYFRHVLATEVAKASVNAARHNIAINQCNNIAIARLSAEELTEAMQGKRKFKRLMNDSIDLNHYAFSTIFVDPPRAGVDELTLAMMQEFDNIMYISCNPDTLATNLHGLTQTHRIHRMAMFDQFPYTHHVEMGVWLLKND